MSKKKEGVRKKEKNIKKAKLQSGSKKAKKAKKPKTIKTEIVLRIANKTDFIELEKIMSNNKKKWIPKYGVPFWLFNSDGEIENKNYSFTAETDLKDFNDWLVREQVLIPKSKFDE